MIHLQTQPQVLAYHRPLNGKLQGYGLGCNSGFLGDLALDCIEQSLTVFNPSDRYLPTTSMVFDEKNIIALIVDKTSYY